MTLQWQNTSFQDNQTSGWVFSKKLEKKYKDGIYWLKVIIVIIICLSLWIGYSFYTQWQQKQSINQQKNKEIKTIEQSFNPDQNEKKIEKMLQANNDIKEEEITQPKTIEETKEKEITVADNEIITNIISEHWKELQNIQTEQLKEEQAKKYQDSDIDFVWDFCFVGSWDNEKKTFFNTFNWENQHLVKTYLNRLNPQIIDYQVHCFTWITMKKWYIDWMIKAYKKVIKDSPEARKAIAKKYFNHLKGKSSWYYEVKLTKKNGMSELAHYEGCWNDETMHTILWKIGIYQFTQKDLTKWYENKSISWNSNCKMPKIWNIFFVQKSVPITKYYNELFKNVQQFNNHKTSSTYKKWYGNLNYQQWLEKFIAFLNAEPFKWSYTQYTNGDDVNVDYINQKRKSKVKNAITVISQIMNR